MVRIPRELGHIWIGPAPAPVEWMDTYKKTHSEWRYTIYDNAYVSGRRFRTQSQIDEYMKRGEYAGAADLIRYEILYEKGGYLPGADSVSLRNTDELWTRPTAYAVYENESVRPGSVSPVMASVPGHRFLGDLIHSLEGIPYYKLDKPWKTTGNRLMMEMIEKLSPDIFIFPSYYFIPRHFTGRVYEGTGPVYSDQKFGSTVGAYRKPGLVSQVKMKIGKYRSSVLRRLFVR